MKVALVVQGGFDRSGRERIVPALLWLAERLARRHEVHVFALRHYPEPCTYSLRGATVHDLGGLDAPPGSELLRLAPRLLRGLRADGPFDVVHGFIGAPAALASVVGRLAGVPVVVTLADGEMIGLADIGYGFDLRWRGRLLVRIATKLAGAVTVETEWMASRARARGLDVELTPLGVDTTLLSPGGPLPDGPPWRLLHVASMSRVKDQATLLHGLRRAVDLLPDIRLDVVGGDTLGGEVQALATRLGLEGHVTFHGARPADQLPAFYRRSHLFVLSSRHEASGIAALEAAACGVPTVGTMVGYVADWSPDRACGVSVGGAEALGDEIVELLRDAPRRRRMAEAARAWAAAHDAHWTAARFEELYRELRRDRSPGR